MITDERNTPRKRTDEIPVLSDDEEAELLATYGVAGPYDNLLHLPAASKFYSDVSGQSVFLTGATISDHEEEETTFPQDGVEDGIWRSDSLRSLLVKHTSIFRDISSIFLLDQTSKLLDEIEQKKGNEKLAIHNSSLHSAEKLASSIRQKNLDMASTGKETVRSLSRKTDPLVGEPSVFPDSLFDYFSKDNSEIEKADELLREAETVLALPKHFDPFTDDLYQRQVRVHHFFSKVDGVDELDDFLDREAFLTEEKEEKEKQSIIQASRNVVEKIDTHFSEVSTSLSIPLISSSAEESESLPLLVKTSSTLGDSDVQNAKEAVRQELLNARLEPLFSFEVEPTSLEKEEITAWDPLIDKAEAKLLQLSQKPPEKQLRGEACNTEVHRIKRRCNSLLLDPAHYSNSGSFSDSDNTVALVDFDFSRATTEHILEVRDQEMEKKVVTSLIPSLERQTALRQQRLDHNRLSQMQLPPIEEVLSKLLPSSVREELHAVEGSTTQELSEVGEEKRIDTIKTSRETTGKEHVLELRNADLSCDQKENVACNQVCFPPKAEKTLRGSHIRMLLLRREEEEFTLMHKELLRMEHMYRVQQKQLEELQDRRLSCEEECLRTREYIQQDEIAERKMIECRRNDHFTFSLKAMELNATKARLAKAHDIAQECTLCYEKVCAEESIAYENILSDHIESEREVLQKIKVRKTEVKAARLRSYALLKEGFLKFKWEAKKKSAALFIEAERERHELCDRLPTLELLHSTRLGLLYEEQRMRCIWYRKKKNILEIIEKGLRETKGALGRRRLPSRSTWFTIPYKSVRSASLAEGQHPLEDSPTILDADRLAALLPLTFTAVKKNPLKAAYYFHTLSLPLESISSIHCSSLGKMTVPSNELSTSPSGDSIAMKRLSQRELRVGDLVREVNLSSNQLQAFCLYDFLQVFPFLEKLELAHNHLTDLSGNGSTAYFGLFPRSVRGVKAAHENAITERFMVRAVDLSSNALVDLSELTVLLSASLQVVSAHSNQLSSIKPLMSCLKLEKLNVSKNRIESVEELSHLLFLRELDLANNSLKNVESVFENNLLLEKLYLSRNPFQRLSSSGDHTLMFLSELFINECKIESLAYDCFPAMPNLSILHANSNVIRRISGLRRCPRLTNVQLAGNNIEKIEELNAIVFCHSLTNLDVSDNPFLVTLAEEQLCSKGGYHSFRHEDGASLFPPEVEHIFLCHFPFLRELNKSLFPSQRYWEFTNGGQVSPFTIETRNNVEFSWESCSSGSDVDSLQGLLSVPKAVQRYCTALSIMCSDMILGHLEQSAEELHVRGRQQFREALSLEERLLQRSAAEKKEYTPLMRGLSSDVEVKHRHSREECVLETLDFLKKTVHFDDVHLSLLYCTNRPVQLTTYAQKAQAFKEKRARNRIEKWIYDRVLIHRARNELRRLQEVYKASEMYRLACSAKIIQRVGRGANIRNRLRNIPREDLLDSTEEILLEELDFPSETKVSQDFRSIVGDILQKMPPETKLKFEVPDTSFFLHSKAPPASFPLLPGSAPSSAPHGRQHSRKYSDIIASSRSDVSTPRNKAETLEEVWGSQVANQILKKDKKRSRERKKVQREGLLRDPLSFMKEKKKN